MKTPNFAYVRARSLKEAAAHLSSKGARIHAGGTDLLGCLRDGVMGAEKVVSISQIKELPGIRRTKEGGLRIGALTTIGEVAANGVIQERYAALARGAAEVGSPQLRNQGTLGGNLCQRPRCWYFRGEFHCIRKGGSKCFAVEGENEYHCILGGAGCYIVHPSDTAPALVALGATVRVFGPRGSRIVPLENFFLLPRQNLEKENILAGNEIVTDIFLPPAAPGLRSSYRKVRARQSWDFALAGVALALTFKGNQVGTARVVLSGAAPIPWRSREVEEVITGKVLNAETIRRAAEAATRNAEPLKHNGYKLPLFRGVLEEELSRIARA
jgi:xanthine dehydrogenase YagS FAD-binding subunit